MPIFPWVPLLLAMAFTASPSTNCLTAAQIWQRPFDDSNSPPTSLPVDNPTKSFWLDTPGANPLADHGSEGILTSDADVCIIGSGITGVSVAYHLSKLFPSGNVNPLKVVILEARKFCSGATGRNGGHVTPYGFIGFSKHKDAYGRQEALKMCAIEEYTANEIESIVSRFHWEDATSFVNGGHNTVFLTEEEEASAEVDYRAAKAAGVDLSGVTWLSKSQMLEMYGAPFSGLRATGHNIWPSKFVTQLFKLTNSSSGIDLSLHTLTPATSITPSKSESTRRWIVQTPRGSIGCSYIVHATNAYASHLLPEFAGPNGVIPTRGQIMALRANTTWSELSTSSWDGDLGYKYWHPIDYSSPNRHPLVILGGGRDAAGDEEDNVVDDSTINVDVGKALKQFLPTIFPGKFNFSKEPEMHWTGIMAYTNEHIPFVGPVLAQNGSGSGHEGQYISAGYTGHGMPRTFACAQVIAEMLEADIRGTLMTIPDWFPERFLTWNRRHS